MSLPSDLVIMLDASKPSGFRFNASGARDGGFVDTLNFAGTLAQSTTADRPSYGHFWCATGPGLVFGGSGAPLYSQPTWMVSTGSVVLGAAWTQIYFGAADVAGCFFEWGNIGSGQGVQLKDASLKIVGASGTMTATFTTIADNTDSYLELRYAGTLASVALLRNGSAVALSKSGSDPGSLTSSLTLTIGSDHGQSAPLTGTCGFFAYDLRTFGSGDTANVLTYLSEYPWYLPAAGLSTSRTFVTIGDSIAGGLFTSGGSLDPAHAFASIAALMLGSRFAGGSSNNFAVSGALLTTGNPPLNVKGQWDSGGGSAAATAAAGTSVIAVTQGGINDVSGSSPALTGAFAEGQTIGGKMASIVGDAVTFLGGVSHGSNPPHLVIPCCINTGVQEAQAACARSSNYFYRTLLPSYATSSALVSVFDYGIGSDVQMGQTIGIENGYQTAPAYNVANAEHPAKPGHRHIGGRLARLILSLGY